MYKTTKILSKYLLFLVFSITSFACSPSKPIFKEPIPPLKPPISAAWEPLYARLNNDKVYVLSQTASFNQSAPLAQPNIDELFVFLGKTPSQKPMGEKITELYKNKYLKKAQKTKKPIKKTTKQTTKKKSSGKPVYRGVVTNTNAELCIAFIEKYQTVFENTEKNTHVPPSIAAALLFVETRLGTVLGSESAFLTLASMAASRTPSYIDSYMDSLPNIWTYSGWVTSTMEKRSNWAYKELKALLAFSARNKLDPRTMPGSMYGAIGICQFMPSNLTTYAADGNNDGVIDLFVPEDAIASLALYLKKNGWENGMSRAKQHRALKTYNRINIYANTILALSDRIKKVQKAQKRIKS